MRGFRCLEVRVAAKQLAEVGLSIVCQGFPLGMHSISKLGLLTAFNAVRCLLVQLVSSMSADHVQLPVYKCAICNVTFSSSRTHGKHCQSQDHKDKLLRHNRQLHKKRKLDSEVSTHAASASSNTHAATQSDVLTGLHRQTLQTAGPLASNTDFVQLVGSNTDTEHEVLLQDASAAPEGSHPQLDISSISDAATLNPLSDDEQPQTTLTDVAPDASDTSFTAVIGAAQQYAAFQNKPLPSVPSMAGNFARELLSPNAAVFLRILLQLSGNSRNQLLQVLHRPDFTPQEVPWQSKAQLHTFLDSKQVCERHWCSSCLCQFNNSASGSYCVCVGHRHGRAKLSRSHQVSVLIPLM